MLNKRGLLMRATLGGALLASIYSLGQKTGNVRQSDPAHPATQLDACKLLTSDELAVQGEPLKQAKPSSSATGKIAISQCYFAMPTTAKSVTLMLVTPAGDSRDGAREAWEKQFPVAPAAADRDGKQGENGRDPEHEKPAARPVEGLGEQAYWLTSPFGGILYVLQGNRFFRISMGGSGNDAARLSHAKVLAQAVLEHLGEGPSK